MYTVSWLIAMVVFLVTEAVTVSLVSIWFAAGSLAAILVSLCSGAVWLQFTVFFLVSFGLLAALRPLFRRFIKPKIVRTNVDGAIGSEGYVTAKIDNLTGEGQVKLGSMYWTARSTDGQPIPEGTLIRVNRVEGVKVFVSPVEAEVKI